MQVKDSRITRGHFNKVLTTLRRRISAYKHYRPSFKIGITGYPYQRKAYYRSEPYTEMIVIYSTSSKRYIRLMEKILVDGYQEHSDNISRGGGGDVTGPPYYLYIVR